MAVVGVPGGGLPLGKAMRGGCVRRFRTRWPASENPPPVGALVDSPGLLQCLHLSTNEVDA